MKVYRLFNQKELEGYEKGDLSEVGVEYENSDFLNINTHEYKEGVRYLHFFKHKEDIQFAEKLKREEIEDREYEWYIGEFNIPLLTLLKNSGLGFYDGAGYDNDYIEAKEYAIPVQEMKADYLSRCMSYEDAHFDELIIKRVFIDPETDPCPEE